MISKITMISFLEQFINYIAKITSDFLG
jgi:hypothetical protein